MPGILPSTPDEQLCRQAAAGNRRAFEELYRRHRDLVRSVARRHSYDAGRIEDLIQETFAEAWRVVATFDATRSSVRTWLAMIASRRCIDALRRAAVRPVLDDLALAVEPPTPTRPTASRCASPSSGRSPASRPCSARPCGWLYGEGSSYREIAEQTRCRRRAPSKSRGRAGLDQLALALA